MLLLDKLREIGISGNVLKWFTSYLSCRSQVVCINSILSDSRNIDIGIPQGSILGPLLFIIYVNSLPNSVSCKCVMYADDTTLLCSPSNPITLQHELESKFNKISKWLKFNQLTLNVNKTKFMIFGTTHLLNNLSFSCPQWGLHRKSGII